MPVRWRNESPGGAVGGRPSPDGSNPGLIWIDPNTGEATISDGQFWKTLRDPNGTLVPMQVGREYPVGLSATDHAANATIINNALAAVASGTSVDLPGGVNIPVDTITIASNQRLRGAGKGATTLVPTGDCFHVSGSGWAVEDLLVSGSANGHIFVPTNAVTKSRIVRCTLEGPSGAHSIWYAAAAQTNDFIDMLVAECEMILAAAATLPAWYIIDSGGGLNSNTWARNRYTNSGAAQYFFHLESSAAGSYANNNVFRDSTGEVLDHGFLRALSHYGLLVEEVNFYDDTTTTADMIVLGQSATGLASRACAFKKSGRIGGALGGGLVDIRLTAGASDSTTIEDCQGTIDLGHTVDCFVRTVPANVIQNADGTGTLIVDTSNGVIKGNPVVAAPGWPRGTVSPDSVQGGTISEGANAAIFTQFQIDKPTLINRICFSVGVQSGNVDVGVYDATGASHGPGARIVHSGATACPAPGAAAVAIPATILQPGTYWAALSADNGTSTFGYVTLSTVGSPILGGTRGFSSLAYPLPDPMTAATLGFVNPWIVYPAAA